MKNSRNLILFAALTFLASGALNAQMPDIHSDPKYGADSLSRVECANNLSTMSEFMKINLPDYAYASWREVFDRCPASSKNIYLYGIRIYKHFLDADPTEERKKALMDTLMLIYDRRIEYFEQKGYVLGRKGIDLLRYNPSQIEEAYGYLKESAALEQDATEPAVLVTYMQTSVTLYKYNRITPEEVVNDYVTITQIIDRVNNSGKADSNTDKASDNVEILFSESGAANCEDLIAIFQPKFEMQKEDADWLKKVTGLLSRTKCEDSELFASASESLYALDPSAYAAYNLARLFVKKEEYEKAVEYYTYAIELETDEDKLADYYYQLGMVEGTTFNRYAKAREYAYEALKRRKEWGDPYILIGNMYVASRESCGENAFEKATVFWAAVDKFLAARGIDPSVADQANELINRYSQYFPDSEETFFYGFKEGDSYTVGCWINEQTTVRTRGN